MRIYANIVFFNHIHNYKYTKNLIMTLRFYPRAETERVYTSSTKIQKL